MEAGSEGENNKNSDESPIEGPKKPKRQMKTPYQLEILEKTYACMYNLIFFWGKFYVILICMYLCLSI